MRARLDKTGDIQKTYLCGDLLDKNWQDRIKLIEELSHGSSFIPETHFERTRQQGQDVLIYRQQRLQKKICEQSYLSQSLEALAHKLDEMSHLGFIHGDINRKNLIFDGTGFRLVDFEPSLLQRRNGNITLIFTQPYISRNDFETGRLTQETDKVGFYFFCHKKLNPRFRLSAMGEMEKIKAGESVIENIARINEALFLEMSFFDIYQFVSEKHIRKHLPSK